MPLGAQATQGKLKNKRNADMPSLVLTTTELDGIVQVPAPVSREHGSFDALIHFRLVHYAQATPGCAAGNNSTWLMFDSAPQPDAYLRVLPSHDQKAGVQEYITVELFRRRMTWRVIDRKFVERLAAAK